jgi:hypothetical protein
MLHDGAQPLGEPLVAFEPRCGGLQRAVQGQEAAREGRIGDDRLGEADVAREHGLLVAGDGA